MAHIQTEVLKLWKPQDLTVDKISSQKMFIDNIEKIEAFAKITMQKVHASVKSLADLRAIDTSDTTLFTTGMLIMVQENGMYSFNRNSTNSDNNAVVKPTVGGGRWITTQVTDIAMALKRVNSADEFDTLLTDTLTNMSDDSDKFIAIGGPAGIAPLYGRTGHILIHRSSVLYATVIMITYDSDKVAKQFTRARYDGVWGKWVSLPYLDENGKIPLSQLPSGIMSASVE